ncbi:hypothetical protein C5U62_31580 [Pseudomonas protegens]|uniref:Uncharacterized protein n=1 Tax=Pseudomonas protegens TaxID=380021 RepID=A0A2T6GBI0_9PSED|nr:hypothetical protein [Pseudomonas protegens]PUA41509.1 hypothetical protein C5U62_31580 [Pseudomonas protegens]
MTDHPITVESARACLVSVMFAPAQQLSIMIHEASEPADGNPLGDWMIEGIFENDEPYNGPLSGLGIGLEPGPVGLVDFRALAGHRPLMPEAYLALETLKSSSRTEVDPLQPWTRWIRFALEREASMPLHAADEAWLERIFADRHCCYVMSRDEVKPTKRAVRWR